MTEKVFVPDFGGSEAVAVFIFKIIIIKWYREIVLTRSSWRSPGPRT
jgi:hypothetical protein